MRYSYCSPSSFSERVCRWPQNLSKSLRMLSGCQGWGTVSNSLVSTEPRSMCRARAWPEGNPASRPKAHSQERLCSYKQKNESIFARGMLVSVRVYDWLVHR